MNDTYSPELLRHASRIVAAYVASHKVSYDDISDIIKKVYQSLVHVGHSSPTSHRTHPIKEPAVPVDESVFDDYIICLEDGKQLQMLKRHLNTMYGMTLDQYKERWNLPATYPVVAPSYARRRSEIARTTGLGHSSKKTKTMKVVRGKSTTDGQEQVGVTRRS